MRLCFKPGWRIFLCLFKIITQIYISCQFFIINCFIDNYEFSSYMFFYNGTKLIELLKA